GLLFLLCPGSIWRRRSFLWRSTAFHFPKDLLDIANVTHFRELHESDFEMKPRLRRPSQFVLDTKQHVEEADQVLLGECLRPRCQSTFLLGAAENLFVEA